MSVMEVSVGHIACTSCMKKIKRGIKKFNGVYQVKILNGKGKFQILFNEEMVKQDSIHSRIYQIAQRTFD
ncbi:heavy-metal-associated domain-containing protein [Neobacillus mesonae]|uniref:heavy-metal-associated domain-containing protein n=1 Tax=Neobacillus mesonae TaxID=1193713 RepID=UPI0020408B74|nr:heavy-metal-associated domain-containing protein [Neobacillus mesonae]MCM3569175.1 heavy-metal-associated domain-containing protein [Neobacillus mesonae]